MGTHIGLFKWQAVPAYNFVMVLTPKDYTTSNSVNCNKAYEVDWGDGTFNSYAAGTQSSVASNTGSGLITVRSDQSTAGNFFTFIAITDTYTAANGSTLTDTRSVVFANCTNITSMTLASTSSFTTLNQSFEGCTGLTSLPAMDTSAVTDFQRAFKDCTGITSVPNYDFTAATTTNQAFSGCTGITSFPAENFGTTNLSFMFLGCTGLVTVGALGTANCPGFASMFRDCTALTTISAIDTTSYTSTLNMFLNCSSLTSPDSATQTLLLSGHDYN